VLPRSISCIRGNFATGIGKKGRKQDRKGKGRVGKYEQIRNKEGRKREKE